MFAVRMPVGRSDVDWSKGAAYVDGEYLPAKEAKISVFDWGLTRSRRHLRRP